MISGFNVIDENGNEIKIDIIMQFRIEELNKEYAIFTVNDDGVSEDAYINITELAKDETGGYQLKMIPENEKSMVLAFYDSIRDSINGNK